MVQAAQSAADKPGPQPCHVVAARDTAARVRKGALVRPEALRGIDGCEDGLKSVSVPSAATNCALVIVCGPLPSLNSNVPLIPKQIPNSKRQTRHLMDGSALNRKLPRPSPCVRAGYSLLRTIAPKMFVNS
jgi:hypothetical protein